MSYLNIVSFEGSLGGKKKQNNILGLIHTIEKWILMCINKTYRQSGELWGLSVWGLARINKHHFPQAACLQSRRMKTNSEHNFTKHFISFFLAVSVHPSLFSGFYDRWHFCLSMFSRRVAPQKSRRYRPLRNSCPPMSLPLTKSVSMLAISQRDIDGEWQVVRLPLGSPPQSAVTGSQAALGELSLFVWPSQCITASY